MTFHRRWDPEIDAAGPIRMLWLVEEANGATRLTVELYEVKFGSRTFDDVVGELPMIVSGLKTLRETGRRWWPPAESPTGAGRWDGGKYLRLSSVGGRMKLKATASLFLLALVVSGCTAVRGSGDVITIDVPIDDFSRLEVSHSFEVNVTVGDEPSLTLRVDDNLEASLNVGVTGDTLRIGLQPRTTVSNATLEADVTVTSLDAIEGSGAVNIHLGTLTGPTLELQLSGASEVDGAVDFESMHGEISGASNISLSGRIATLDIEASGASDLSLLDLEVDVLAVRLSGASSAEVSVTDSIEASLSGASSLRYRGDPDVSTLDVSGASSIGKITDPG